MQTQTELSYRKAAVDCASPIGLLLALYDTLSGNLSRAASALHSHNIERRCAELDHAYTVLGHLESWLDTERPDPLTESLALFYGYLRVRMLQASIQQSAPMLNEAVELILKVRATWQQRESLLPVDGMGTATDIFTSVSSDMRVISPALSQTV